MRAPSPSSVLGHQQLESRRHLVGDLDHAVHHREAGVEVSLLGVAKALEDEVAALMVQPVELEVGGVAKSSGGQPSFSEYVRSASRSLSAARARHHSPSCACMRSFCFRFRLIRSSLHERCDLGQAAS